MQRPERRYENTINRIKSKNLNLCERRLDYGSGSITIFYIRQLTDRAGLSELVIKPLLQCSKEQGLNALDAANIIFADDCFIEKDENNIERHILKGMSVMLFSGGADYLVVNLKKAEERNTSVPEFTYTIRGPRDAFVEHLDANLSLIRYRIKDESLKIDMTEVGKRNKSAVAVIYLEEVANNACVLEIKKRIAAVDVDGLCSSGELQAFMQNSQANLFPQMGIIERSDMACGALLEGKVIILMDGDPWALVAPKVFCEYLWPCDDFYLNKYISALLRILRVLALSLSFAVSAFYVAVVSFHNDILPGDYLIAIAQARSKVPFTALIEVLLIELIAELIRESLIRVPTKIGMAIGIVGATIIGQAAVSAGIFSPLLLIVIATSLIASFVPSDYSIVDPFRVLKFPLIIASGTFGFYGFTIVIMFVIAQLVSINTFGAPYMAPVAPFNRKDFAKSVVYNKAIAVKRPEFLRTKDDTRAPQKPPEKGGQQK